MSNSKVIVFDVYKTLIDIQSCEDSIKPYNFISSWLSYKGLHIKPKDLRKLYRETVRQKILANVEEYPDIDIKSVFKTMLSSISNTAESDKYEADAIEMGLLFRIVTTKLLTIYPETIPTLEALHKKVRLAVLSNTQRLFTLPEFRKFDIEKYFECILFSSDVKVSKPNPKIFTTLLNMVEIQPQEAIYVGDNLFDDIFGAQKVGMQTVWIDRGSSDTFPNNLERPIPDRRIKEISERDLADTIFSLF